jgi:hypothetical protein
MSAKRKQNSANQAPTGPKKRQHSVNVGVAHLALLELNLRYCIGAFKYDHIPYIMNTCWLLRYAQRFHRKIEKKIAKKIAKKNAKKCKKNCKKNLRKFGGLGPLVWKE